MKGGWPKLALNGFREAGASLPARNSRFQSTDVDAAFKTNIFSLVLGNGKIVVLLMQKGSATV